MIINCFANLCIDFMVKLMVKIGKFYKKQKLGLINKG